MAPYAAPHPCSSPRCPALIPRGARFCDEHQHEYDKTYEKERGNFRQRGYSARWDKARRWYLKRHPICEACNEYAATLVHHKIKVSERPDLLLDQENMMACCRECHDKIHKEDRWKIR